MEKFLIEHVVWNDEEETISLVPDKGQGAVENPSDDIARIWYSFNPLLVGAVVLSCRLRNIPRESRATSFNPLLVGAVVLRKRGWDKSVHFAPVWALYKYTQGPKTPPLRGGARNQK